MDRTEQELEAERARADLAECEVHHLRQQVAFLRAEVNRLNMRIRKDREETP